MPPPIMLSSSPFVPWYRSARLGLGLCLLGVIVVFWPTLVTLHHRWTQWDGAYAHGYFMVAFCLYVVFARLPSQVVRPYAWPLAVTAGVAVGLLWSAGFAAQVGLAEQLALYGALLLLVLAVSGWAGLWRAAFPLALMTLSIPVWEVLIPPLQSLTTFVATEMVRLLEIPAFIDEHSFTLPFGTVVIAGGCAGLNYLMMGFALSSLNALYRGFNLRQSLMSIALLVALVIVGNWARVTALILIAYQSQMQSPLVYDHGMFGWWIFAGLFLIYLVVVSRIQDPKVRPNRPSPASASAGNPGLVIFAALLFSGMWALPGYVRWQSKPVSELEIRPVDSPVLRELDNVRGDATFRHAYQGVDRSEYFELNNELGRWGVARLIYWHQTQGKEMISNSNRLTEFSYRSIPSAILAEHGLQAVLVDARQPELRLWQYRIGTTATTRPWQGKIQQLQALLNGQPAVALWQARKVCSDITCESDLAAVEASIDSLKAQLIEPLLLY